MTKSAARNENLYALTPAQSAAFGTILLTGATGRLGAPTLERLVNLGLKVRVVTPDQPRDLPGVEWVKMDFLENLDFEGTMDGVTHVVHLGAELWRTEIMDRINGTATDALVVAAEKAGVRTFLYTSSICVYGSSRRRRVTEETPLMPAVGAQRSDYMEKDFLIEYGCSKLLGEVAIRKHAARCRYVVLRPTEITWEKDILKPATWSKGTRIWRGNRHAHQVYYKDVVNTLVFFLLRSVEPGKETPRIDYYNLSNDDAPDSRFIDFMRQAWKATGDERFRAPFAAPLWLEYIKDHVKWKVWNHCYPLGLTFVDPAKLYATGYRHEHGLTQARLAALQWLKENPDSPISPSSMPQRMT